MPDAARTPRINANGVIASPRSITATQADYEMPVVGKWPRAWRLVFLMGTALIFWAVLFAAIRLI